MSQDHTEGGEEMATRDDRSVHSLTTSGDTTDHEKEAKSDDEAEKEQKEHPQKELEEQVLGAEKERTQTRIKLRLLDYQEYLAEGKPVFSTILAYPNHNYGYDQQQMYPDQTKVDNLRRGKIIPPDPEDVCGACFLSGHQLKECPHPNNPAGFLFGCGRCNKNSHPISNCPVLRRKPNDPEDDWYYLRECREGLCPAMDYRDFRFLPDRKGCINLKECLPLTPWFALKNVYYTDWEPSMRRKYDPFWDDEIGKWSDSVFFRNEDCPVDKLIQRDWNDGADERVEIVKFYTEGAGNRAEAGGRDTEGEIDVQYVVKKNAGGSGEANHSHIRRPSGHCQFRGPNPSMQQGKTSTALMESLRDPDDFATGKENSRTQEQGCSSILPSIEPRFDLMDIDQNSTTPTVPYAPNRYGSAGPLGEI